MVTVTLGRDGNWLCWLRSQFLRGGAGLCVDRNMR